MGVKAGTTLVPAPSTPLPGFGFVDGAVTNLAVDPTDDRTLYVGTNGYGVFKTVNGGKTGYRQRWPGHAFIKGPRALLSTLGSRRCSLPAPSRVGYTRAGWSQDLACSKHWWCLSLWVAFAPATPVALSPPAPKSGFSS